MVRIKSALCLWQAENEYQRARNQELVKLQEESSIRQEQARRATEEQIQAQRRQTEREKAEIERETIRVRAMAEAEGRAHEAKLAEDINRRILVDRANAEREKWVAAINTTFDHIGGMNLVMLFDLHKKDLFSSFGILFYPLGYHSSKWTNSIFSFISAIYGILLVLAKTEPYYFFLLCCQLVFFDCWNFFF